jgi:hypothetical protein
MISTRRIAPNLAIATPPPTVEVGAIAMGKKDVLAAITALQATGMTKWEALGALASALGSSEATPLWATWTQRVSHVEAITKALMEVAREAPEAANTWLNAWLSEHRQLRSLKLEKLDWITSLPDGLRVQGRVHLAHLRNLAALPGDLKVGGQLDINQLPIVALPADLQLGGNVALINCAAVDFKWGRTVFPANLGLYFSAVDLPDGLTVAGSLVLHRTRCSVLPERLAVVETLSLVDCRDWDGRIPADARVGGRIITGTDDRGVKLEAWRQAHPEANHGGAP